MPVVRPVPAPTRPATRERDAGLDVVRVVGVLAVVAGHTWTDGWVRDAVFPWHVAVFFVLTGFLWRPRSPARETAARAASLLRPYALWLAVAALAVVGLAAAGLARPVTPAELLWGGTALGGPLTSFWFVTALFAAAVLHAVADRAGATGRALAVAVAVVAVAAGAEPLAALPLGVGTAVPALLFVEAGRLLRDPVGRPGAGVLAHPLTRTAAVAVLAVGAAAVVLGAAPQVDLKTGAVGGPAGVLAGVAVPAALVVLALPLGRRLTGRAARGVTAVASALVPVVLLHPVVLTLPAWGGDAQRYATAVVVPLVLALLLARTRLSGWALGR